MIAGLHRVFRFETRDGSIRDEGASTRGRALTRTIASGAMLSLGFLLALAPWTIRNERVFGLFQPIAPAQANMPGEFVPNGYIRWLKTWVDDVRYTLLQQYNNPPSASPQQAAAAPDPKIQASDTLPTQPSVDKPSEASPPENDEASSEEADSQDQPDEPDEPGEVEGPKPPVEMTPEVDAGFAQLATERIAKHPLRYYLIVPLKRASSLWFDTHSQYYPFQGELLPLSALDTDLHQQYWLSLFTFLTLLYTLLGFGGAWLMLRSEGSRIWFLMLVLLIVPRLAFLASMENPEPRYVVEFFAFVAAAGSLAVLTFWDRLSSRMKRLLR
jgi:hypothetical protein